MIERVARNTSSTSPLPQLTAAEMRRREIRERARQELPIRRRRFEEALERLHRLAPRGR